MPKMPLKIGYFADGIWALNALKMLHKDKDFKLCFLVPRFEKADEMLIKEAQKYGIAVIKSANINTHQFAQSIEKFNCDLLVSMSFNQIFKKELLDSCPIINCHASKLPFYRGRNPINWALINDEKEFGISVHFVDSSIDTGDIILQKSFAIQESDDYTSLLNIAHKHCAKLLFESLKLFVRGKIQRIKQESIDKTGSYYPPRKQGDEIIDFSKSTREIFNFIRALNAPDLGALAFIGKESIRLYESEICLMPFKSEFANGLILALDEKGFLLKLKDGVLKINKFAFKGTLKAGLMLKSMIL